MKIGREVDVRIDPHPFKSEDFQLDHQLARKFLESGYKIYSVSHELTREAF